MSKPMRLKTKITLLFMVPVVVLLFFSINYIETKLQQLQRAQRLEFVAKQTQRLTRLVRNIQLERGLSAGYIVAKDKKDLIEKLQKQFHQTDAIVQSCIKHAKLNRSMLSALLPNEKINKIERIAKTIFHTLEKRKSIRLQVLNSTISFDEEIAYYSSINTNAMNLMKFLLLILQNENFDSISLLNIEKLKEYAGLERACIYNQLISGSYDQKCTQKILFLEKSQKIQQDEFNIFADRNALHIFHHNFNHTTLVALQKLRNAYLNEQLTSKDAQKWFSVSTHYIDALNAVSFKILLYYVQSAQTEYNNAKNELILTLVLLFVAVLIVLYIFLLLHKIFQNEERQLEELRIASYAFDSQEAIAITDLNEKIVKVNKGFSNITGYSEEEAIGSTPRILQSGRHSKEFFQKMWQTIQKEGRWKGDIFNKRKNGEIYPERLSITAIKDDKGETTHYIAHFLDITDLKNAQQKAEYQANHDTLTGIANRKLLLEILHKELSKAKRHSLTHAFLFIDLDHFKAVNDTYGHHIGDLLIRYTADVLTHSIRKEDFAARISGDEFAVLLLNLKKESAVQTTQQIAQKILDAFNKKLLLEGISIENISASIGIRIFPKDDDESVEKIIKDADSAMYQAKENGKNRYLIFGEE